MAYTEAVQTRIDYLRGSVRLQDPSIETDTAYKFTDDELYAILSVVAPTHNPDYTIETTPDREFHLVNLLAKREIYYRLSTSTAPFYPLSAEGAKLEKNIRFDHYFDLVKQTEKDYTNALQNMRNSAELGEYLEDVKFYKGGVRTFESYVQGKHFSRRNYNQASTPTVELTLSAITQNSVCLDWTKFSASAGLFESYTVYVGEKPHIDEYADIRLRSDAVSHYYTSDIHRLKYRIENLKPDTDYYVCIVSRDRNGLYGYAEQTLRTLPIN